MLEPLLIKKVQRCKMHKDEKKPKNILTRFTIKLHKKYDLETHRYNVYC